MQPPYGRVFSRNSQTFPWFGIINLYGTSKVIAILLLTSFPPVFPVLTLGSHYCCFKFPDELKDKNSFWVHIKTTAIPQTEILAHELTGLGLQQELSLSTVPLPGPTAKLPKNY